MLPVHYRRLLVLVALLLGGIGSGCRVDDRILTTTDASISSRDASIGPGNKPDGGAFGDARVGEGGTRVCEPGQLRCGTADVPQKCNSEGTAYVDQSPCPSSTPICDATTGTCTTACTSGDKRCSPAGPVIQQCDLQGIWKDTQTCQYVCGGKGPTTECTGECPPGTRSCGADDTPYLCDDTGTNKPGQPCTTFCSEGVCAVGECKPNDTRCAAGANNMVQTCDGTGHWAAATACAFVCDPTPGNCGGECSPGAAPRCSGNTVQSCDATGHWQTMTVCQGSPCSRGQCRPCTASEKQCNAGKPQTCSASGVWTDDQAAACTFTCDPATGLCAGECAPGTDSCAASVSKHCDAAGSFGPSTTCPNICDSKTGRCGGLCPPTTHHCNGQNSETCGPDGQWGSGSVCQFGCNTTTGQCNACTDEPMTTTCAGGKCGPTINNCSNTVMCSSTCAGMGESCGGGGVAGVCGCRPEAATQTCQNGMRCGNVPNNCGAIVACASNCVAPQTCGGGATPNVCGCTPKTQTVACAGKNCDAVSDGCGAMINCGTCTAPQTCGGGSPSVANVCGCTPRTAAVACGTRTCGTQPDGCGGTVNCGSMGGGCPTGTVCNSNGTCASTCTPLTACPTGANCGSIDNGCRTAMITCGGNCTAPNTCGGGGTANVCGCTPLSMTAACAGKCGSVSNGCGGMIDCGNTCTAPNTCAGGGTANMCGCTPLTMAAACTGGKCGSVSNGCGGMIDCGNTCTAPNTCAGNGTPNVCGCMPRTAGQACAAGQNCNSAPNGCGGTVSCGTCTSPQTCGGGGTTNVCGCRPTTCPTGSNCGTVTDICSGNAVSCGSATCGSLSGQGCSAMTPNVCGCARNPMATTCNGKCGSGVLDNCQNSVTCPTNCSTTQECSTSLATPPTGPNVCCTRESDATMCSRLGKTCNTFTGVDSCGITRTTTTSCGSCPTGQTCGTNNTCNCAPESDTTFCTRLRATCGVVNATDNCGSSRSVNCGTCATGMGCCGANTCVTLGASPNCGSCGVTCDSAHACSNSACRLVNGQRGCVTATDCVSPLPCTRFFTDLDTDGQGDLTKPVMQCGTTPGTGLVTNSTDCCDTNPDVFRRPPPADPTAGPWFNVAATNCPAGHRPFDYDCDGFETQQDAQNFIGCGGDAPETCGPINGIFPAPVPACGVQGAAIACNFIDGEVPPCLAFEQFLKIQACR